MEESPRRDKRPLWQATDGYKLQASDEQIAKELPCAKRRNTCSGYRHDVPTFEMGVTSQSLNLSTNLVSTTGVLLAGAAQQLPYATTTSETTTGNFFDNLFDDSFFDQLPEPVAERFASNNEELSHAIGALPPLDGDFSGDLFDESVFEQLAQLYSAGDPTVKHGPPPAKPPELDSATNLANLLDFSQLSMQPEIESRFSRIAHALLHDYRIEIANSGVVTEQLELLEVEFYLYNSGCHEDPFTHASPEQHQYGQWYFHRPQQVLCGSFSFMETTPRYCNKTGRGLELTIGLPPPASSTYGHSSISSEAAAMRASGALRGGVLIRAARNRDWKVFTGPAAVVDEVLQLNGASNITELVNVNWHGDISAFEYSAAASASSGPEVSYQRSPNRLSTMYLVRAPSPPPSASSMDDKPRIFRSPRIGLIAADPSVPFSPPHAALSHPRVRFFAPPYRFFVRPYLLTTHGRGQTFIGIYDALVAHGHFQNDSELLREVLKVGGVPGVTSSERYLYEYRKGLLEGEIREWVGPEGRKIATSTEAWLRMLGTLRRFVIDSGFA